MVNTGSHVAIDQSCGGKGRESNKEEEEDFGLPHGWLGGAFTLRLQDTTKKKETKVLEMTALLWLNKYCNSAIFHLLES